VMPRLATNAAPLSRMVAASLVKSPFSQSALFAFISLKFYGSKLMLLLKYGFAVKFNNMTQQFKTEISILQSLSSL
jgi:hypothetical protein